MTRVAVLALALVAVSPARASQDYVIDEPGWNGLSLLVGLARGLTFDVVVRSSIDWKELDADDVVFILYPTKTLDPANVVAFIRNGGRVLLADDFGRADDTIERLSMIRRRQAGRAASYYQRLPFAPEARPAMPNHALARGVDKLTCNHPAILTEVAGHDIVFETDDGNAIVVSGRVGSGRFVVLSDPSVLINRMLQFDGNLQFATNLLSYLRRESTSGRLVLLTGAFDLRGRPTDVLGDDAPSSALSVNRWLESLNDYFLTENSLRIVAALIFVAIGAFALRSTPLRRRPTGARQADWIRIRGGRPANRDMASVIAEFDHDKHNGSFEYPATVVRDRLVSALAAHGIEDPLTPDHRDRTLAVLRANGGGDAEMLFRSIEGTLRRLPTRSQAAIGWHPTFVSKREFMQLAQAASALYRTLGRD